jgi:hypothetical protein
MLQPHGVGGNHKQLCRMSLLQLTTFGDSNQNIPILPFFTNDVPFTKFTLKY